MTKKSMVRWAFVWGFIGGSVCVGQAHSKDAFQWKTSVLIDQDHYGAIYQKASAEKQSHTELRRAKLNLEYGVLDTLKSELELVASEQERRDDGLDLADAWLRWQPVESPWRITVGRMKEPMGHERLMGVSRLPLIERSMVSSAFAPGRQLGLSVNVKYANATITSGVFQADPEEQQVDQDSVLSWTSRLTHGLKFETNQSVLHIGGSVSLRDLNDTLFQLEERGEVNSAENIIQSARFYANRQVTSQFEMGYQFSRLWFMGEYFTSEVRASDGDRWQYDGFYLQMVYGNRYKYKNGRFKGRSKVTGLWEGVIRYSGLNLRDHGLGTEAGSFILGVNYYVSQNWTVMLNHLRPTLSGNVVNSDLTGSAISARVKFRF